MGVLYGVQPNYMTIYLMVIKLPKIILFFPGLFHSSQIQGHAAECGTEVPTVEARAQVSEVLLFFPILIT